MQKVIRLLLFFSMCVLLTSFSRPCREKINWISIAELEKRYHDQPKPILIDVYTSWCGWCKRMDKTTYEDRKLIEYVNSHYYAVKFDAESRDSLSFNGKNYGYMSRYRTNELAMFLLSGQLQYPTTVFLPAIDAQPAPLAGYLKPREMEAPLKYFGEGVYKIQSFTAYDQSLKKEW